MIIKNEIITAIYLNFKLFNTFIKMSSVSKISDKADKADKAKKFANGIYLCIDDYWFDVTTYDHPGIKLKGFNLYDVTAQFYAIRGHVDAQLEQYEIKDQVLIDELNECKKHRPVRKYKFHDSI